jgi:hypothetical protein
MQRDRNFGADGAFPVCRLSLNELGRSCLHVCIQGTVLNLAFTVWLFVSATTAPRCTDHRVRGGHAGAEPQTDHECDRCDPARGLGFTVVAEAVRNERETNWLSSRRACFELSSGTAPVQG